MKIAFPTAEKSEELQSWQRPRCQVSRTLMTHTAAKHLTQCKTLLGKSCLCLKRFVLLHWRKKRDGSWGVEDGMWGKKSHSFRPILLQGCRKAVTARQFSQQPAPATALISKFADWIRLHILGYELCSTDCWTNALRVCVCSEPQLCQLRCFSWGNALCDICLSVSWMQQYRPTGRTHVLEPHHFRVLPHAEHLCSAPSTDSKPF